MRESEHPTILAEVAAAARWSRTRLYEHAHFAIDDRLTSDVGCRKLHAFGEVKRQQVTNVSARCPLWHLGQHMMQIGKGLDLARPACQHEAIDDGARLRARNCVSKEP